MTDTAAKAEIQTAIATVQEEVAKSTTLLAASATNAAYAEQRERLGNAVDNMMTKITDNGFTGNSVVNGVAAVTAQLSPISTSTNGTTIPVITDANGATIEDTAFNKSGYALDPTLIVSLSVYGNSLRQTTLLVLKQTLITMLLFQ